MRTLFVIAALLLAMNTANATGYHHVAAVVTSPKAASPVHHHAHKFGCLNPGGIVVCTVVVLIVGDEVKRTWFEGLPACATGKWRQSWFGKVRDEPKLWRPKCSLSNTVSVRG